MSADRTSMIVRAGLSVAALSGAFALAAAPAQAADASATASASTGAPATPAPAPGRGRVGGLVQGVTDTLDGTIQTVSTATGGAVSLPTTGQLTSTVDGTLTVVGKAVGDLVAPVVSSGPQVSLQVPGLAKIDGGAVLGLVLANTGTEACTPIVGVSITGADGVTVSGGITKLLSLAPGSTGKFVLPWPAGLLSGDYNISTTASGCGTDQTVGLSISLAAQVGSGSGRSDTTSTGGGGGSTPTPTPAPATTTGTTNQGSGGSGSGASDPSGSSGDSTQFKGGGTPSAATTNNAVDGSDAAAADATAAAPRRRAEAAATFGPGVPRGLKGFSAAGSPAPAALLRRSAAPALGARGRVDQVRAREGSSGAGATIGAVVKAMPAVLERAAPILAVLGLVGAMFVLQEGAARRDPKLALAPLGPVDDLEFDEPTTFLSRVRGVKVPPAGSA